MVLKYKSKERIVKVDEMLLFDPEYFISNIHIFQNLPMINQGFNCV